MKNQQSRILVDLSSRWFRSRPLSVRSLSSIRETSSPSRPPVQAAEAAAKQSSSPSSFRLPRPPTRTAAATAAAVAAHPSSKQGAKKHFQKYPQKTHRSPRRHVLRPGATMAEHLQADGEKEIPNNSWIIVTGTSPVLSLDYILSMVQKSLDQEYGKGMVDLDAPWNPHNGEPVPFCSFESTTTDDNNQNIDWIEQARIELSLFARPSGWFLKLKNRSVAYALIKSAREKPMFAPMRGQIQAFYPDNNNKTINNNKMNAHKNNKNINPPEEISPLPQPPPPQHMHISDATLRVEGCAPYIKEYHMLNLFSRYDLREDISPVVKWRAIVPPEKGHVNIPPVFLVHFADASWARAALREKQSSRITEGKEVGDELVLAQYPKQKMA